VKLGKLFERQQDFVVGQLELEPVLRGEALPGEVLNDLPPILQTFFSSPLMLPQNKLVRLPLPSFFRLV
jgi:hypothetical protein